MSKKTPHPRLELKQAGSARETRAFALQVKAVGDDGTIEGYGSVFGVLDQYSDVIAAGAFAASLAAHRAAGTMPAMLWQHDSTQPIGIWMEMTEDAVGLRVRGRLALDTMRGKEAYALLKMAALNGLSIGFVSKAWNYDQATDVRTLTEVDLWELSLVTFPANEQARITGIKAADVVGLATVREAEKALRDAGFSADAAKAFLAEVKRLHVSDGRDAHEAAQESQEAQRAMKAANRLLHSINQISQNPN